MSIGQNLTRTRSISADVVRRLRPVFRRSQPVLSDIGQACGDFGKFRANAANSGAPVSLDVEQFWAGSDLAKATNLMRIRPVSGEFGQFWVRSQPVSANIPLLRRVAGQALCHKWPAGVWTSPNSAVFLETSLTRSKDRRAKGGCRQERRA